MSGRTGAVLARGDHTAARSLDLELNEWMTVLDRRRELGTLRLIGSTRRQVMRMIRREALLVALAGIALGAAIAPATPVPMTMNGLTGQAPYVPPLVYG
ncbi:FtsX-like permease family protein [Streptomyces sp. NPDC087844]|uniref:FtsX-like permease family protein n=1 Tax=Streptomyces sp. NPDC087844 TaxID=3365805 RepID=UPI00380CD4EF